jgi:hypothetical protein
LNRATVSRLLAALAGVACALAAAGLAVAEQFRRFDEYEIHFNAFRADFVPAEVAERHGLTRARNRGLVNITVLRAAAGGATQTLEAAIELTATRGDGAVQPIRMRAIRDGDALNYLGEFRIGGEDSYRFEARVTPGDAGHAYEFSFVQTLVAD